MSEERLQVLRVPIMSADAMGTWTGDRWSMLAWLGLPERPRVGDLLKHEVLGPIAREYGLGELALDVLIRAPEE